MSASLSLFSAVPASDRFKGANGLSKRPYSGARRKLVKYILLLMHEGIRYAERTGKIDRMPVPFRAAGVVRYSVFRKKEY